jgi:uncharacterized protein (DUF58 family)
VAADLPLVPGFLARFIERWAVRRLPEAGQSTTLVRQRIYILPSKSGMTFFIVLLVILFGAINYENSLAFMLTFLLGSIGFLGMLYTHQNLNHLSLSVLPTKPVFAGQNAAFPLLLSARPGSNHLNIRLQGPDGQVTGSSLTTDSGEVRALVNVQARQRGRLYLKRIKVYSEFPLGLFHAWSWVELSNHCLVYPQPDSHPAHFHRQGQPSGSRSGEASGNDDFAGIRAYQKGDSPMHLAWKAVARTGELQTKHFHADAGNEVWLDWYQLPDTMDTEQRLCILCRQVLDADQLGLSYGLQLPGLRITPAGGLQHRQQCLKQLALFGDPAS